MKSDPIVLSGLDGGNPLAFLAALGTLRAVYVKQLGSTVRMSWAHRDGAWRPILHADDFDEATLLNVLHSACQESAGHPTLALGEDLTISVAVFREHALQQAHDFDREATAFVAAFGSEAMPTPNSLISDTALRTMSGAGHQHFLKTMRSALDAVTEDHLERALFSRWDYADPLQGFSLRFDPVDDKRYALQWGNPSKDSTRGSRGNMLGANGLAVLGVPLLAVAPERGELQTTGFRGRRASDCFWTWPIWEHPIGLDVVSSLLAKADLQEPSPPRGRLSTIGIVEVFRSQRITTDKYRNFTPARAI